ncbi:MAG TPA: hypothetical protein VFF07_13590 [Actinomycetota bacterium]|nr:hypothetical protein [Actinomycetota bacterium]
MASSHALIALLFKAGYVSAQHGVLGLVKALALEGAEHGIASWRFAPALFASSWSSAKFESQAKAQGLPEERVLNDVIPAPHAIKRLIEPEEVAAAEAMLLGPPGELFTGTTFTMDPAGRRAEPAWSGRSILIRRRPAALRRTCRRRS